MAEATDKDSEQLSSSFNHLIETVRRLRDPGGCPWDAEQTHESLRENLLEEAYEVLDAIESQDAASLEEELGDLLIQIAFHADIAARKGEFDADSICEKVAQKLIRRHPHVYGDATQLKSGEDVIDRWEQIKRAEAGGNRSLVASVPKALPALAQAAILQRRVKRAHLQLNHRFDLREAFNVASDSVSSDEAERIAGDFLVSTVDAILQMGVDPETALRNANTRMRERVLRAEAMSPETALAELQDEERERIWRDSA